MSVALAGAAGWCAQFPARNLASASLGSTWLLVSDDFAIGILSLVIAALYPIPRTSVLGANPPDWLALRRDSHAPARG
jgi:hypothetical protein